MAIDVIVVGGVAVCGCGDCDGVEMMIWCWDIYCFCKMFPGVCDVTNFSSLLYTFILIVVVEFSNGF